VLSVSAIVSNGNIPASTVRLCNEAQLIML